MIPWSVTGTYYDTMVTMKTQVIEKCDELIVTREMFSCSWLSLYSLKCT